MDGATGDEANDGQGGDPEAGAALPAALKRPISEVKAELFKALAHPARVRVLEVLAGGERPVAEILPLVGIEASHLSQQLTVLRRAGLVENRREGASVVYALRDPQTVELLRVAKRILITEFTRSSALLDDLRLDPR